MNFLKSSLFYLLIIGFVGLSMPRASVGESNSNVTTYLNAGSLISALLIKHPINPKWVKTSTLRTGSTIAAGMFLGISLKQLYYNYTDNKNGKETWGNPGFWTSTRNSLMGLGALAAISLSFKSTTAEKAAFWGFSAALSTIPHFLYEIWPD